MLIALNRAMSTVTILAILLIATLEPPSRVQEFGHTSGQLLLRNLGSKVLGLGLLGFRDSGQLLVV